MSERLDFSYRPTPYRYVARYRGGAWEPGFLTEDPEITLSESACVFQYAQSVFEGLKARRTDDGRVICFRPDRNIKRMSDSCVRMCMPPFPEDLFLEAIDEVVRANAMVIPECSDGSSLYLRPFMIGTDPVLGVKPATEFEFRIFASPVGPYFSRGIRLRISDYDRAAPRGTGNIKAGLNYAMSLYPISLAHVQGYDENLYLDSATRTYIEETGGANIFFLDGGGKLVTPMSDTILPSITRDSVLKVASGYLGLETEERRIELEEAGNFSECGLCGTAAVISPVESIDDHGRIYSFPSSSSPDSITAKLKSTLTGIMEGRIPAPEGWIHEVSGCRS